MRASLAVAVSVWLVLASAACGDSGVAALRIALEPDLSGTVTTSSLLVPASGGPLEEQAQGVSWSDRAHLYCASGRFASLGELRIADLAFAPGDKSLRVTLPRGPEARWLAAFVPAKADRNRVAETFDPRREFGDATGHVSIEIDVPGTVVSTGVHPRTRGLATDTSGERRAVLVVPVDRAEAGGDPITWDITWK